MAIAPDGRFFVTEQGGALRVVADGELLDTPFLTVPVVSTNERGLLGVAFDPGFSSNRHVYVYYTAATTPVVNRVSRFTASSADPNVADPNTEVTIVGNIPSESGYHNGGALHFGTDGKLYVAVGEGHIGNNAQSLTTLAGKILRIDTASYDPDDPFAVIPRDNPFYGTATGMNRAIWALGLRNPFTFDIQPGTGRMFINDVGESSWEEINEAWDGSAGGANAGFNFGWPETEGPTNDPDFRSPFFAYEHGGPECAIAGGTFYNPTEANFPARFVGDYFFADFCAGWIKSIDLTTRAVSEFIAPPGAGAPVDLRVDSEGSLYYLSRAGGSLHRVRYLASPGIKPVADFAGDGSTDIAVWRPSDGVWYVNGGTWIQWWQPGDIPVPGDYDGDSDTDIAVWRPSDGFWYVRGGSWTQWGQPGDVPVPGDYDGDGDDDVAVWRSSDGFWYVRGGTWIQWGEPGDVPVPADYDGDDVTDIAVWRPSSGVWYVRGGAWTPWGQPDDVPVPGDYDDNGTTDVAVWRPADGFWYVHNGSWAQWGQANDIPVPGDYNGDGQTDIAVWRPGNGFWYVRGGAWTQWGQSGDKPLPPLPSVTQLHYP